MAKLNKNLKLIIGIIIIIFLIGFGYFINDYIKQTKRDKEIESYKKDFYFGILCQYNCPLSPIEYKNKTQMLPDVDCVKKCSEEFKNKYKNNPIKSDELKDDNLLKDIDSNVNKCKETSLNKTSFTLDNSLYFDCAKTSLKTLEINYSYLK